MSDRRRATRYVLTTPLPGQARPMQDAVVEQFSGDRLVVISSSARRLHDELMVHLSTPEGVATYPARVMASSPVSVEGTMNFRLELRITGSPAVEHDA